MMSEAFVDEGPGMNNYLVCPLCSSLALSPSIRMNIEAFIDSSAEFSLATLPCLSVSPPSIICTVYARREDPAVVNQ